jgi:hypothetical protein
VRGRHSVACEVGGSRRSSYRCLSDRLGPSDIGFHASQVKKSARGATSVVHRLGVRDTVSGDGEDAECLRRFPEWEIGPAGYSAISSSDYRV